jgi:hypothetical protein
MAAIGLTPFAGAQNTAFTYQGFLTDGGASAKQYGILGTVNGDVRDISYAAVRGVHAPSGAYGELGHALTSGEIEIQSRAGVYGYASGGRRQHRHSQRIRNRARKRDRDQLGRVPAFA